MRKIAILTSCVLMIICWTPTIWAEGSEEKAVLAAVQRFFDAMAARDVKLASEVLMQDGRFFSVREVEGNTVVRSTDNADFLKQLGEGTEEYLERMWDAEVQVHGDIATVWTPYDFHRDGVFSHCGIDAFDLIKTPKGWQIVGGVYTVERVNCPESPLGPAQSGP